MIEVRVVIDDADTGELVSVKLPSDLGEIEDHELYIVDWDGNFDLSIYDPVELNGVLDTINAYSPYMTISLLHELSLASHAYSFFDADFVDKICDNDFMLEHVATLDSETSGYEEELSAHFLATELRIPFAKNITPECLEKLYSSELIGMSDWAEIWIHYTAMGFKYILFNNELYVFHWGDSNK